MSLIPTVTTDVQSVRINCRVEGTNYYVIQCSYVEGSDARGCVYSIMGQIGAIARSNSEGVTVELVNATGYNDEVFMYDWESNGTTGYNEVFAYDWESDGTIGTIPVTVDSTTTIEICPTTIGVTDTTTISKLVLRTQDTSSE